MSAVPNFFAVAGLCTGGRLAIICPAAPANLERLSTIATHDCIPLIRYGGPIR
jgi:hypothetical protein